MARIIIISAVFPPEPVVSAQISESIAKKLVEKYNVTVLCPKPTRPFGYQLIEEYTETDYEIIKLNSYTCPKFNPLGRFRESYSFGKHCVKYIKENRSTIDCIYLNSWPLFAQYLIIKIARKYNIRTIIHIQDIYPESLFDKMPLGGIANRLLLPLDHYILSNSTSVIAISERMKYYLVKTRHINADKVIVVHNWQDEEHFIRYRDSKKDSIDAIVSDFITFMYMGNNGPLAGVELLIKSFVKAEIKNSKLIIAGSGSMTNSSKALTNTLNAKYVEFYDVPDGAVPDIQDIADIMLLPMKKGGAKSSIPSKLPAYMFSAKPIIGSLDMDSDTAKAITDSGCGMVVEPEDEIQLAHVMTEMSEWNKQKLKEMGKSGFEYAIRSYSKSKNLNEIITLIEKHIL